MKRADLIHLLIDGLVCVLCILTFIETRGLGRSITEDRTWRTITTEQIRTYQGRLDKIEALVDSINSKREAATDADR